MRLERDAAGLTALCLRKRTGEMVTMAPLVMPPARRVSIRREFNLLLNLTLLGLVVLSFVTGWTASLLGLTEFGLHKYSSIALLIVATGHLALHWGSLSNQVRRRLHRSRCSQ